MPRRGLSSSAWFVRTRPGRCRALRLRPRPLRHRRAPITGYARPAGLSLRASRSGRAGPAHRCRYISCGAARLVASRRVCGTGSDMASTSRYGRAAWAPGGPWRRRARAGEEAGAAPPSLPVRSAGEKMAASPLLPPAKGPVAVGAAPARAWRAWLAAALGSPCSRSLSGFPWLESALCAAPGVAGGREGPRRGWASLGFSVWAGPGGRRSDRLLRGPRRPGALGRLG